MFLISKRITNQLIYYLPEQFILLFGQYVYRVNTYKSKTVTAKLFSKSKFKFTWLSVHTRDYLLSLNTLLYSEFTTDKNIFSLFPQ